MILYMITHHDTGQADLVRIMLDLRFGIGAFQFQAHWLYFFTWEAMSVSHTQHRLSLGSVRCSPDPMQLHHIWVIELSGLEKDATIVYTMTCHNTGLLILWESSQIWDLELMPFNLKHTDSMFSPEKQSRDRTRSAGYRSGQWDAHQIPCNFIMFEHLNVVPRIKVQWAITWSPNIILAKLILRGWSQIWDSKWMPFHLNLIACTFSPERK